MAAPTPDWHAPVQTPVGAAWAARDLPGVAFVAPTSLAGDGPDAVSLDVVGQDLGAGGPGGGGDGGARTLGLLRQRLVAVHDDGLRSALADAGYAQVRPLPVRSGLLRLLLADAVTPGAVTPGAGTPGPGAPGPGAPGAVEPDDATPGGLTPGAGLDLPLDGDGVNGLVAAVRLSAEGTELVLAALRRGAALVRAHALLRVDGFAARHPGTLDLDVAACLAALAPGLTPAAVGQTLRDDPDRLGATLSPGVADDVQALARAVAAADRIVARCASADLDEQGQVVLRPASVDAEHLRLDLSDDVLVPRYFAPATDPWGPLAEMSAKQVERVVHRHTVPALDDGRRTVRLTSVIAPPWAGAAAVAVELTAPPRPPLRPGSVRRTVLLTDDELTEVELPLAPGEPLAATARVVVVPDGPDEERTGPPVSVDDEVLVLRADAVPADLLAVRLAPSLAAQAASVTVTWRGGPGGEPPAGPTPTPDPPTEPPTPDPPTPPPTGTATATQVSAALDAAHPTVTLLLPPGVTDATLTAEATHPDGRTARTAAFPAVSTLLDPLLFEGTGRHDVVVHADLSAPGAPAILELDLVSDGGAATVVRLTPAAPTLTWTYLALSPFATGYRWRPTSEPDLRPGPPGALDATPTDLTSPGAGEVRVATTPHPEGVPR